ncbi:MAG: pilus assembly protein PilM [Sedimentisphaerales bacterium]|nr:pilus assembly protein PilM [Sedimentisphaerales bacterium]
MLDWLTKNYLPIGLDWGSTALRAVQLFRDGSAKRDHQDMLHVHAALEIPFPDGFATEPDSFDAAESLSLTRLIDRGGFVGRGVILNCPLEKMDVRPVTLPSPPTGLPREAVLGAVRLQIAGHLSFPVERAVFDYVLVDRNDRKGQITVLAFATDSDWITHRIDLLRSLGLQCVAVDAVPCTLARLARYDNYSYYSKSHEQADDILTGVLDVGFHGSTLVVCGPRGPIFCRRFQLGGRGLTQALAQRLMIDERLAEKLKIAYGIDSRSRRLRIPDVREEKTDLRSDQGGVAVATAENETARTGNEISKTIFAALQADLNEYVEALIRTLNYVIAEQSSARLDRILLSGSAGVMDNLDQFLNEYFELPVVHIANPLLAEITRYLPSTRCNIGSWTTALGLALAGEDD